MDFNDLPELLNKKFIDVFQEYDSIVFLSYTECFTMEHSQFGSENVYLESVSGDLVDLIDAKIVVAQEASTKDNICNIDIEGFNKETNFIENSSFTWTFYKIQTCKGAVTLRWYGSSNGYYGEEVEILKNSDIIHEKYLKKYIIKEQNKLKEKIDIRNNTPKVAL